MHHYLLCGLKVESDIAFPELTPWPGEDDRPCDLEFRLGPVERLEKPDARSERFETLGSDKLVFLIPRVGKILIEDGRRIIFDALPNTDPERVRLNFIGILQAVLWYQRGYLPLHASSVMVADKAIVIGGATGSGKSVVAAALVARGCALVADDFTIVDTSRDHPVILPGYQKLRLWKDACEQLGMIGAAVAKAHPVYDKYVVATDTAPPEVSPPMSDMFILAREQRGGFSAKRLSPVQAVQNLLMALHLPDAAQALGRQAQIFSAVNAIASTVRLWRVTAPDDLGQITQTADAILELARS